jgi:hypothetical protein
VSDGGRPRAAAVDRRVVALAAVAGACGLALLVTTLLPWYGATSAVRIGETVEIEATPWAADGDLEVVMAVAILVGVAASAVTVGARLTARAAPPASRSSLVAALAFGLALLVVGIRLVDPPGSSGVKPAAVLALGLGAVAMGASVVAGFASVRRG